MKRPNRLSNNASIILVALSIVAVITLLETNLIKDWIFPVIMFGLLIFIVTTCFRGCNHD